MDWLRDWGMLLALGINGVVGWAMWSVRRGLVSREDLHRLERRVDANKAEIDRVGTQLHGLPGAVEWAGLREQIAGLKGALDGLHREQQAQNASIKRIEDYLLKQKP